MNDEHLVSQKFHVIM